MLRYMGWTEAADLILKGVNGAISAKTVTYDFERLMEHATKLSTSEFGDAIIAHMDDLGGGSPEEQYDELAERFRQLYESSTEKGAEVMQIALDKAREQLTAAGKFTEVQGNNLKEFLERDFSQAANVMREEASKRLNIGRLSAGALSSITTLLNATGQAINTIASKADKALNFRSGEITSAGTLTCKACGNVMHFRKTGRIPPCPKCHATEFRKSY